MAGHRATMPVPCILLMLRNFCGVGLAPPSWRHRHPGKRRTTRCSVDDVGRHVHGAATTSPATGTTLTTALVARTGNATTPQAREARGYGQDQHHAQPGAMSAASCGHDIDPPFRADGITISSNMVTRRSNSYSAGHCTPTQATLESCLHTAWSFFRKLENHGKFRPGPLHLWSSLIFRKS